MGRTSVLKLSEIACPLPDEQPFLCQLTQFATVAVETGELLYGDSRGSVWDNFQTAECLHDKLRTLAKEHGIGFARRNVDLTHDDAKMILLHNSKNCLFHAVLATDNFSRSIFSSHPPDVPPISYNSSCSSETGVPWRDQLIWRQHNQPSYE